MKTRLPSFLIVLVLHMPLTLFADSPVAESASYQIDAAVMATGGLSSGGLYQNTGSLGDVGPMLTDVSTAGVQNRAGFVASLYELTSLEVQPGSIDEATTGIQLTGTATYDDATTAPLAGSEVLWSGFSAPILNIDTNGLANTDLVSADTAVPLTLDHGGVQSATNLTVLDSEPDNFGIFAGDDLPDGWQMANGLVLGQAGFGDNPDGDEWPNAFELLLNIDPLAVDEDVVFDQSTDENGFLTLTYVRSKLAAQLYLDVQAESSSNLQSWDPSNVLGVSIEDLGNGTEKVVVRSTNDPVTEPRDFLQIVLESK